MSLHSTRAAYFRPTGCAADDQHVIIGKEDYMLSADGLLMPVRKDQPPPDLRKFEGR